MEVIRLKNPKALTEKEKMQLTKAVKKIVSQYRTTLELLAKV